MPRKIVPLVNNEFYHVYNRGTDKRDIFTNKSDYLRFYQTLNLFNTIEPIEHFESARALYKLSKVRSRLVEIYAYALLPNHYHLILKQLEDGGISEYLKRVSGGYTSYFNKKQKRNGVLFQGKFKRVHIERNEQYNYLLAYVNENHFVHNVQIAREICHSSSLHYQGIVNSVLLPHIDQEYNFNEGIKLAQEIYLKRQLIKTNTMLE